MQRVHFRRLVGKALDEIPEELAGRIENVVILVRTRPSREDLEAVGLGPHDTLLGLYVGQPLTARGTYGNTLPDRIYIYEEPILEICRTQEEVIAQVRETVLHEIAHHFGIDDDRLDEIGISPARDALFADQQRHDPF